MREVPRTGVGHVPILAKRAWGNTEELVCIGDSHNPNLSRPTVEQNCSKVPRNTPKPCCPGVISHVVPIRLTPQAPRDSVGCDAPGVSSVIARV